MLSLGLLSKYRTQLMGMAIIGIMLFHSSFPLSYHTIMDFIVGIGYAGVEIFFLVSGFGIFFAINRGISTKEFLKKRLLRILPYYLPIVFVFSLMCVSVDYWTWGDLVDNMLMIGFWKHKGFGHIFDWYIPAQLLLYLLTPIFYFFYKKNKVLALLFFSSFSLLLIVNGIIFPEYRVDGFFLFLYRAPLYFLGFAIADFYSTHKDYKFSTISSIVLFTTPFIGVSMLLYWYFNSADWFAYTRDGRDMLVNLLITIPTCFLLVYLMSKFKNYSFPVLSFFGTYTLNLYIFHERVWKIGFFTLGAKIKYNDFYYVMFNITAIILSIVLAVYWQKLVDKLVKKHTK